MPGAWIPPIDEAWPDGYVVRLLVGPIRASFAACVEGWAEVENEAPELQSIALRLRAESELPGWADYGVFYDGRFPIGIVTRTNVHIGYVYVERGHRQRGVGLRATVVVVADTLRGEDGIRFVPPFSSAGAALVKEIGGEWISSQQWARASHEDLFPVLFTVSISYKEEQALVTVKAMSSEQAEAFGRDEWAARYRNQPDYPTRLHGARARASRVLR